MKKSKPVMPLNSQKMPLGGKEYKPGGGFKKRGTVCSLGVSGLKRGKRITPSDNRRLES